MPFGPAVLDGAREVGRIVFTTFTAALLSPKGPAACPPCECFCDAEPKASSPRFLLPRSAMTMLTRKLMLSSMMLMTDWVDVSRIDQTA